MAMLSSACSTGSPSTSGLQLPSFSAPKPSPLRIQVSPHPASAPPTVPLPTHAEGQQKNVEQELDTFHSSFHRHGCRAWGRGERRGMRTGRRGTSVSVLPAGPRGLPCAAPIPGPSHPETRGQIHVSQPPLLPGWRGVGATAAKPGPAPPPPRPGPDDHPRPANTPRVPTFPPHLASPYKRPSAQARPPAVFPFALTSPETQAQPVPTPNPPGPPELRKVAKLRGPRERPGARRIFGNPRRAAAERATRSPGATPTKTEAGRGPRGLTWAPQSCALFSGRGSGAL